jgi:hypothetical protein
MWAEGSNIAIALLAGILAGLLIFIPIGYYYRFQAAAGKLRGFRDYAHEDGQFLTADWNLYRELKNRNRFLGQLSPVSTLDVPLRANLLLAANNIIESFRNSSDAELSDYDWAKARLCLIHALEIEPSDWKAKGELAICNGYLNLLQNPKAPKAALSIDSFRQAETYLPRSADPHLGLAHVYIYAFHNVGEALAEFHQAEQLGFKLGPREAKEKADGYLFRAEWELSRAKRLPPSANEERSEWLQMARDDTQRASSLYEPIVGFSNVSASLEQLNEARDEQTKLQASNVELTPARPQRAKHSSGVRRWR